MNNRLMMWPAIAVLMLIFWGCAVKPKPVRPLEKVSLSAYPQFADDMAYDGLKEAMLQSLSHLKKLPPDTRFVFGGDTYDAAHMIRSLRRFLNFIQNSPSEADMAGFLEKNFIVYRAAGEDDSGQVLFTGYFEPLLKGSLERKGAFEFPVYAMPYDLITADLSMFSKRLKGESVVGRLDGRRLVPYYTRAEIEQEKTMKGRAKILAWVDDRVELFFLQIQGSGKIRLEDGNLINVHYHAKNGRPYRSIGKLLIESGKIPKEKISMQSIREYLKTHPDEADAILNANPSYVFFRLEKEGPIGALGVKLTPGRSLAVDRRIMPLGGLAFVRTKKPTVDGAGKILEWNECARFVLNQDTGGAIRGPGRADLFWGDGHYAEIAAGHMQHYGDLYLLVLKPDA